MSCLGTEGAGFEEKFPGIRMHVLTLASNFQLPIFRDFLMSMGFYSVSRASCESILRKRAGNAITIVVGGAAESLNARPGYMDLKLRNRLGFIRIAMRTGADLVPTIGFGENDLYDQVENEPETWLYKFQMGFKSLFGWTMPMFLGRGLLHRNLGWMPYMRPLYIVGAYLPLAPPRPLCSDSPEQSAHQSKYHTLSIPQRSSCRRSSSVMSRHLLRMSLRGATRTHTAAYTTNTRTSTRRTASRTCASWNDFNVAGGVSSNLHIYTERGSRRPHCRGLVDASP